MWTSGSLALLLTWAACPVSAHRIARDEAPGAEVEKLQRRVEKLEGAVQRLSAEQQLAEMNIQAERDDFAMRLGHLESKLRELEEKKGDEETTVASPNTEEYEEEAEVPVAGNKADLQQKLEEAAAEGHAAEVVRLMRMGADASMRDESGRSPLHWAAREDQAASVEAFASEGTDLEMKDDQGNTPLHLASIFGKAAAARALLTAGADANAKNQQGLTPKELAEKANLYGDRAAIKAAFA
ncbi:Ankrd2 [Symbiodinium natans]|uniref:Ankrd2 protein n=1 Tax=Symbiodinium natans TaxID=878477 RepID=A0A812TD43_9DINO|nr:Ankrd2 [Symbiodinium natans]